MRIVDGRPVKSVTHFYDLEEGETFYFPEDEEIYIKAIVDDLEYGIRLCDGHPESMYTSAVVNRVKGHFVIEEIEE